MSKFYLIRRWTILVNLKQSYSEGCVCVCGGGGGGQLTQILGRYVPWQNQKVDP